MAEGVGAVGRSGWLIRRVWDEGGWDGVVLDLLTPLMKGMEVSRAATSAAGVAQGRSGCGWGVDWPLTTRRSRLETATTTRVETSVVVVEEGDERNVLRFAPWAELDWGGAIESRCLLCTERGRRGCW